VVENYFPPSYFVLHRVLFLYGQRVSSKGGQFIIGNPFSFVLPVIYLSCMERCTIVSIFIAFLDSVLLVLIVYFCSFFLLKFYDFQFNHSILISIYNIFRFGPSTFDFLFCSFFLLSKFLCFQFYPSSQFYDFYFFNNNKNFNSVILLLISWFFFLIFLSQFL
jgi:hypothetical protein